ncbi:hypothetical protein [Georgenia sp. H159]|uniref:AEC family transporter n=1 Tax=Georgenia sp. H159 TaxID=3076115 RepID=UPI002D79AE44|nr:hypothetical protein [Georgenia sp. H159]
MGDVLVQAVSLVAIIGLGFTVKRIGWVSVAHFPVLATIVLRITLPAAIITGFNDFDLTWALLSLAVVGLVANVVQQGTGMVMGRRRGREAQAFGVLNIGSYNMGAFAMPYLAGFMGPQALVLAALFDVGNAVAAAGIGYAWALGLVTGEGRVGFGTFLRTMLRSTIFVTYLVMVPLRLLDLSLPGPVVELTATIGAANTFLAMFMIGVGLELRLSRAKYRQALTYLVVRYGYAVVFALGTWLLLPVDTEVKVVLCMVFFAPIAAMAPGYTAEARGDVELSTFMTSVTIIVGMVTMPVVLAVLG